MSFGPLVGSDQANPTSLQSMSSFAHRLTEFFNPPPKSWEEYVEGVGLAFYLRNLAQNATMLAFLGWVSILHFGPNQRESLLLVRVERLGLQRKES